jgi:hypothetical protein
MLKIIRRKFARKIADNDHYQMRKKQFSWQYAQVESLFLELSIDHKLDSLRRIIKNKKQ